MLGRKPGVLSATRADAEQKIVAIPMLTEPKQFFLKVVCKGNFKERGTIVLLSVTTLMKVCKQTEEMT